MLSKDPQTGLQTKDRAGRIHFGKLLRELVNSTQLNFTEERLTSRDPEAETRSKFLRQRER